MEDHAQLKELPDGFPLELIDANGTPLFVGDQVRLLSVDSCLTGLLKDEQDHLYSLVGSIRTIMEIDVYGFVWLVFKEEYKGAGADFSLKPTELALEKVGTVGQPLDWPAVFGKKEPVRFI